MNKAEVMQVKISDAETIDVKWVYDPEEGGYYVMRAVGMPGAITQGRTLDEASTSMIEAYTGMKRFHEMKLSGDL